MLSAAQAAAQMQRPGAIRAFFIPARDRLSWILTRLPWLVSAWAAR